MRNLSAAALAEIANDFGSEPITIVEIQWVPGGPRMAYADRDITGARGKIIELPELDSVLSVTGGTDSHQIGLVLDDTDGHIKSIFNANDIHKRPVWVYQWFEGLPVADKFLIFKGQINSPVEWSEEEQVFRFDVVSKIEDKEIGFSAEEGQFPQIPADLIGKPWPMIFGTCQDVPALSINRTVEGTTQQGVGILSGKDHHRSITRGHGNEAENAARAQQLAMVGIQISHLWRVHAAWSALGGGIITEDGVIHADAPERTRELLDQINQMQKQLEYDASAVAIHSNEPLETRDELPGEGPSIIRVLGGEDFPQNVPVTVDINGGKFTGIFYCQDFHIHKRWHPENDEKAEEAFEQSQEGEKQAVGQGGTFHMETSVPVSVFHPDPVVITKGLMIAGEVTVKNRVDQLLQHFWADAGSRVVLDGDVPQNYIVSIIPGTVLAVKAFKTLDGVRKLVNVPSELWDQVTYNFGSIQAEGVRLTRLLSSIPEQGWGDDIYVTFESTVGPNTVDIMQYLVETYSDLEIDASSFATVKTALTPFPSNFVISARPQIVSILRDIAFQARCAVLIKDDVVYMKYLPTNPTSVATITDDDVAHKSISVTLTPTEDLVTKMVIKWRTTYAPDGERKMVLRHNVEKYGVQEQEYDWFIYTQPDIIRKAATFWLMRLSNTWKRIKFQTYLNMLPVETFDAVTLDMSGTYVSNGAIKVIAEQANYDSGANLISFDCWVPVRAGEMTQYKYAWPQFVEGTWPLPNDFPGGANVGANASGELPVGTALPSTCPGSGGIFVGGPNVVYAGPADIGDPTPQDTGFTPQDPIFSGTNFEIDVEPRPTVDLKVHYAPPPPPLTTAMPPDTKPLVLDLSKTQVVDSANPQRSALLKSLIREISEQGRVVVRTDAMFGDETNTAEFDFEHDPETDKFGAGTAFLAEDE